MALHRARFFCLSWFDSEVVTAVGASAVFNRAAEFVADGVLQNDRVFIIGRASVVNDITAVVDVVGVVACTA